MELKTVRSGDRLRIPADVWNALQRLLTPTGGIGAQGGLQLPPNTGLCRVRNDSGGFVARYGVLGIGNPIILPANNLAEFQAGIAFIGATPAAAHAAKFVILLEPLADGVTGRAAVAGVTVVQVNVSATADTNGWTRAEALTGDTAKLDVTENGSAQILYRESGTGTKWAVIRIGDNGTSAAGGSTITVEEADGSPSLSNITGLIFDQADGFIVSLVGAKARIDIAPASVTQIGVVDTGLQRFAGHKQFDTNITLFGPVIVDDPQSNLWTVGSHTPGGTLTSYVALETQLRSPDEVSNVCGTRILLEKSGGAGGEVLHVLYSNDTTEVWTVRYAIEAYAGATLAKGASGTSGGGDTVTGGIVTALGTGGNPDLLASGANTTSNFLAMQFFGN